jgi:hypothetical protein
MISWNTKSRIRNNVIYIELIYTFDLTINIFTIDISNRCILLMNQCNFFTIIRLNMNFYFGSWETPLA